MQSARTILQRMSVRALDFLPPADCTIAEYAEAVFAADRSVQPEDEEGYRGIVHGVFARRGLVSKREKEVDAGFVGVLGAFEIYRGSARGHRMANLRIILR